MTNSVLESLETLDADLSDYSIVKMLSPNCLDSLLWCAVDAVCEALKIQEARLMPPIKDHVFKQGQSVFLASQRDYELTSALAHLVFIRSRLQEMQSSQD